jgi:hypothetical protein
VTLLALADVPPAAVALMPEQSPVSTVTWMSDIVTDFPLGDDGWRLVDCRADTVMEGYSSQAINIWNQDGRRLLVSRQYVAVFA